MRILKQRFHGDLLASFDPGMSWAWVCRLTVASSALSALLLFCFWKSPARPEGRGICWVHFAPMFCCAFFWSALVHSLLACDIASKCRAYGWPPPLRLLPGSKLPLYRPSLLLQYYRTPHALPWSPSSPTSSLCPPHISPPFLCWVTYKFTKSAFKSNTHKLPTPISRLQLLEISPKN